MEPPPEIYSSAAWKNKNARESVLFGHAFSCESAPEGIQTGVPLRRRNIRKPRGRKIAPSRLLFAAPQIMTPSLTTVHIHTQIMAVSAVQLLISRLENPDLNFRIVHTETELIYRDSTAIK